MMVTNIYKTFRIIALLFVLLNISSDVKATHIIGGDITYKSLGANQFEITLTLRRDCALGQVGFDNPASIGLYSAVNNVFFREIRVPFVASDTVGNTLIASCGFQGSNVCVQTTTYKTIQTLPFIPGGYILAYQRCCRNGSLNNVINPLESGSTEWVEISERALSEGNSSPSFLRWPEVYICANQPLIFDHSASDVNGDSLVYKICTPFDGGTIQFPQPQPPATPPYNLIQWRSPYGLPDMMGGTPLVIDSKTGIITATPNLVGQYLIGICVEEYRNGVLISTIRRDFQYNVRVCNVPLVADFDVKVNNPCDSLSYAFTNKTKDATSFEWNFNFPSTESKFISTQENPLFTFDKAGKYVVRLLVRSSTGACDATVTREIDVRAGGDFPALNLAVTQLSVCPNERVQLLAVPDNKHVYKWSPTVGLDLTDPANPIFLGTSSSTYMVTVTNANNCSSTGTITFIVKPKTDPLVIAGSRNVCEKVSLTVSGGNSKYEWSNTSTFAQILSNTATLERTITEALVKYFVRSVGADCGDVIDSVTVTNQKININFLATGILCSGSEKEIVINNLNSAHILDITSTDQHLVSITGNTIKVKNLPSDGSSFTLNAKVTNQFACSQDISILFTIIYPVVISGDKNICGDKVTLTASGGNGNFQWSSTADFAQIIANTATFDVTLKSVSEKFYVRHTASECTEYKDSIIITNQSIKISPIGPLTICSGSTKDIIVVNLNSGHNLTFTTDDPHIVSIVGNIIKVKNLPSDGASFTLNTKVTNQFNCSQDISILFTIIYPVVISGDKNICGDKIKLTASGGNGNFQWSSSRDFTLILSNTSILDVTLKSMSEIFYVRHTSSECTEYKDSIIITNQSIKILPIGPSIICSGSTKDIIVDNLNSGHNLTFTGDDPHIVSIVGNIIKVKNLPSDGASFTLNTKVTNQFNCSQDISILFTIIYPVVISGDKNICGDKIKLTASGGNGNFQWSSTADFAQIIANTATLDVTLKSVSEKFYVRHTSSECTEFKDSIIITNQSIKISPIGPSIICSGSTKDIIVDNLNSGHNLTFTGDDPHIVSIVGNVIKVKNLPSDGASFTLNTKVTNQFNCSQDISILFTIIYPVVISGDRNICGDKIKLTASGGNGRYEWSSSNDFKMIIGTASGLDATLKSKTETFFVRSPGSDCPNNLDSITVTNQSISISVPDGGNICKRSTKDISIQNLNPGHNLVFTWNDPHIVSVNGNIIKVTSLEADGSSFEVKGSVINQFNCSQPISIRFAVKDQKPATFVAQLQSCKDFTMCFTINGAYEGNVLWKFGSGLANDTSSQKSPCFNFGKAGKYKVNLTNLNSECPFSPVESEITVPEIGDSIVSVNIKQDVCKSNDVCFSINGKYIGNIKWEFGDPTSSSNTSALRETCHNFAAPGSYMVTLKNENVLCPFKEVKTNVIVTPKFALNPIANQTVCEGQNVTFNATSNAPEATYNWFDATGKLIGSGPSLSVNPMNIMSIKVQGTNGKGCQDSLTVNVTIFKFNYTIELPQTICPKTEYQVKLVIANPENYTFSWTPADVVLNGGTTSQPILLAVIGKSVKVEITNKATGCKETKEITPAIKAPLVFNFVGTVCNNSPSTVTLNITNPNDYTYLWTPATAIVSGGATNTPIIRVTAGQQLKVLVTNKATGCSEELTYNPQVLPPLTVIFTEPNIEIKQGASTDIFVRNPISGATYTWNTGDRGTSIKVAPLTTTTYTVTVSDANGCTGSGQITVNVRVIPCTENDEYLPNAFTPNGDSKNDILLVKSTVITELEFVIYNRWGQEMFKTTNINEGWDGKFEGNEVSPDVYAYYIKGTCLSGDRFIKKGNVSLFK